MRVYLFFYSRRTVKKKKEGDDMFKEMITPFTMTEGGEDRGEPWSPQNKEKK